MTFSEYAAMKITLRQMLKILDPQGRYYIHTSDSLMAENCQGVQDVMDNYCYAAPTIDRDGTIMFYVQD